MAITTDEKLAVVDGLVKKIFDDNGLGVFVDGHSKNRFRIDPSTVRSDSREVFEKDVADQMLRFLQRKGMYARNKELMEGKSSFTTENVEKIGNAIRSANGLAGAKDKSVFSIFGRDPKKPLGAVSERDYSDAAFNNGISVDEIKRLVGDYRKQMGVDMSEARRLDTDANVKFDRVKMAGDFNQGKYDEGFIDWAARNGMKYLSDNAYRQYIEQIKNGEGSDEFLEDAKDSFVNGDGRLRSTLIDAGKNMAQIYGPKGAGSVVTKIPKAGPAIGKAAAGVGDKLATTPIGNSVGSKVAYAVNPMYDMGVEAGAQLADRGEVDADRVAAVGQSSLTWPLFAGIAAQAVSNVPGRLRSEALAFQRSAKRGSSNSFDTRLDMRDDYARLQKLKKVAEAEAAYPALKATAKADYEQALNEFKAKYPHENVEQLIAEGADKSKVGVAPAESYLQRDEALSPSERLIVNYQEPSGNGLGAFVGSIVSPASQQITRAKYDSGKLEEMYAEEEKKRKEAMKKAQEVYRKYGYCPYPQLLSDEQPEQ